MEQEKELRKEIFQKRWLIFLAVVLQTFINCVDSSSINVALPTVADELGVTMAAYKGASDAFTNAFEGMDLTPFIEVEKSGTLIQHPSSKYTTRWESGFTTGLLPAWEHPETMADVCRDMAVMMNEVLAEE